VIGMLAAVWHVHITLVFIGGRVLTKESGNPDNVSKVFQKYLPLPRALPILIPHQDHFDQTDLLHEV
jgi:hypothetical protein